MRKLDEKYVRETVREALKEDGAWKDATLSFLRMDRRPITAEIVAADRMVLSGIDIATETFKQMDPSVEVDPEAQDGDTVQSNEVVCRLQGPAPAILAAERVSLNFLQRLSGIATLAQKFTRKVKRSDVTILDTRKTTPLWRDLEKYAVRCGGAENHRRNLESMVLIKENHIRSLGGETALVDYLRTRTPADDDESVFVEVEVDSVTFLRAVLDAPVDRVMLDNFTPARVREAIRLIRDFKRRHPETTLEVEVSGGITLDNVSEYALDGVDYISVGALTHSAPAATMSLEVL